MKIPQVAKGAVVSTVVTLLLLGQGMLVGHYLGPWGGFLSFALGFGEGYAVCGWMLKRSAPGRADLV